MTEHRVLNPLDHARLHIRSGSGAEFGDAVMACLAVPLEFRRLAWDYPILFRYDSETRSYSAFALLGFEPGENLFVEDGHWAASCRPLAISVQPFLIGRSQNGDGPAQVHIDLAHPRVELDGPTTAGSAAVFDKDGNPTAFLDSITDMLGALDEGYRESAAFMTALSRNDLLEPFSMDVTLATGESHRMVGYHLIHEERLRQLEPSVLIDLHRAGHLEPIFMALASLGNLAKLLRRKNLRVHG